MKKLVLITISMLLGMSRSIAQNDNYLAQDKTSITTEQPHNIRSHTACNSAKPANACIYYRPLKHFRGIPVYLKDYGFESAKHPQQRALPLRVYFAGNYTGRKLNNVSPAQAMKTMGATSATINKSVLPPKENAECASVFGCSSDNGVNIGITKNTTLGISFSDDDGGNDSISADNSGNSYTTHDMDISVSLLVGLR